MISVGAPGSGLQELMNEATRMLDHKVFLASCVTSKISASVYVRFSMAQTWWGGLGENGMAKKVALGVDQNCCFNRVSAWTLAILVTRKHHGAA